MADVNAAVTYVLRNEDRKLTGVVTKDRGGFTRFGIAQVFHPNLDPKFYTCPREEALAWSQKIYAEEYGKPLRVADIKSQPIANKILDFGVNAGVSRAAKLIQNAVCDVGIHLDIDGNLGPASIAAINQVDQQKLMDRLIVLSQNYYRATAIATHASADEIASWLTRAGKPGI